MDFIDSITHYKVSLGRSEETIAGERDMIDLLEVVKRYFYNLPRRLTGRDGGVRYLKPDGRLDKGYDQ